MNLFLNYYAFLSLLKNPSGVQLAYLFSEYFNYLPFQMFFKCANFKFLLCQVIMSRFFSNSTFNLILLDCWFFKVDRFFS